MRLQQIEIAGFKSFAKKANLTFTTPVTAVVGPNGSGKSNVVEAFRFVLGEQSMKSMRGKSGADLIFRGGTGAPKLSRASVSITFDNSDKVFAFQSGEQSVSTPLLFDTITFTREIFADGTSKYLMNGTEIRLKQMHELLASVHIGATGHHIISQGEADGILRANARDRREMLEDALGLKHYHARIKESVTKLERTKDHLKEVQSLRRELAPHLKFLSKQVEKVERAQSIRQELHDALIRFLGNERGMLAKEEATLENALSLIAQKKKELETALAELPEAHAEDPFTEKIAGARQMAAQLANDRRTLEQQASKLEGMIEAHRRLEHADRKPVQSVSFADDVYTSLLTELELAIRMLRESSTLADAQRALTKFESVLATLHSHRAPESRAVASASTSTSIPTSTAASDSIRDIVLDLEKLQKELAAVIAREQEAHVALAALEDERTAHFAAQRSGTEARYRFRQELTEANAELQVLHISKNAFMERKERYDSELKDAGFLFGTQFLHALKDAPVEDGIDMHDLSRAIDRLKIRLDEHAGIGNEVVKEFEETQSRDAFLAKEISDIDASVINLERLIVDLKKVLDERFTDGVKTINTRFSEFFKTMFGGGGAFLEVTIEKKRKRKNMTAEDEESDDMLDAADEEEQFERGIEVHVSLPEKKVKELTMLSGGERSLVSIALLFAISQVNPPPFLVLDETDAALDEANSRRYGDMVERLSAYSQLIVVTHNRETMSRAQVLYGVTLGADAGSKLLSIKFDEAVKVAK